MYGLGVEEQDFESPEAEDNVELMEGDMEELYEAYGDSTLAEANVREEVTGVSRIEDRTAVALKERRKGRRDPATVKALVLHQMAFSRGNNPDRYNGITAHYAILPNGSILQLHPVSALLWASNGFNRKSVAVEFAGNLPNTKGKCWQPRKFGCHKLTREQIEAGRYLVRYLKDRIGLTHIFAHRQALASRENCPGPDIWYNVGQWAVTNLGLSDGGPGYKITTGNPIPDAWRTWGGSARKEMEVYSEPYDAAEVFEEYEDDGSHGFAPELFEEFEAYGTNPDQFESGDPYEEAETGVFSGFEMEQTGDGELEEFEAQAPDDSRLFRKLRYGSFSGYRRAGGGRLDRSLKALREARKLSISDADIDMLQRIANVETGGLIQAINSYDSAVMSMGFMQWTVLYGELQSFIAKAAGAFRKHGIELSGKYKFRTRRKKGDGTYYWHEWTVTGIKGAPNKDDLRSLEWARKFYYAGLDPDVLRAEAEFALEKLKEHKLRIVKNKKVGTSFLPYYGKSASLRALIHETFNNRPAYLYDALGRVATELKKIGSTGLDQFTSLVHGAIRAVYKQKEGTSGLRKANNLITKTARPVI